MKVKENGNSTHITGKISFLLSLIVSVTFFTLMLALPMYAADITPDDTFEVTEVLTGISIATAPDKTVYDIGDRLSADGLKITLEYNSGRSEVIAVDALSCSGFDSSSAGVKTVAVSYRGFVTSFDISVREITDISIESTPKTEYTVGDTLDLSTLTLKVKYSTGETSVVDSGYTIIDGYLLNKAGETTVVIGYMGKSCSFTVKVKEPKPTGIKITVLPSKTEYIINDKFVGDGAVISVNYENGTTAIVTSGLSFTGFSSEKSGDVTVTVHWNDLTDSFTVNVRYPDHTHKATGEQIIVKETSCAETGLAVKYCDICGIVAESSVIRKKDHEYGNWVISKEATAQATGTKIRNCKFCSAEQFMTIDKLSNTVSDGKHGIATAKGNYLFPAETMIKIANTSGLLTSTELAKLNPLLFGLKDKLVAVFDISFSSRGKSFVPGVKITYKVSADKAAFDPYTDLKVMQNGELSDAVYQDGFLTFTTELTGRIAVVGLLKNESSETTAQTTEAPQPPETSTPAAEVTTAPGDDTTSAPVESSNPPNSDTTLSPEVTSSPETTEVKTPETTQDHKDDDKKEKISGALKTILIVIIVIAVIGATFELIYLFLKNKYLS